AALAGDLESARNVELVLPETGVCSTDLGGSGCCSVQDAPVAAPLVALGRGPGLQVLAAAQGGGCCE
ncbi:MAG TPA: hypothetical protein VFY65_00660, partial [Longimicrobium sp.]|nr:hypothetical protein [Longimicrobium sp.]